MTQKERLVELLKGTIKPICFPNWKTWIEAAEQLADHLLSNGVIVPPCKVGDWVYEVSNIILKRQVVCFEIDKGKMYASIMSDNGYEEYYVETDLFGEDIFLTHKQAEQALKEREGK